MAGPLSDDFRPPIYINWIALFNALLGLWNTLESLDDNKSDYIKSSKLRDAFEIIGSEFAKSGLAIQPIPGKEVPPDKYEKAVINFIKGVFATD